MLFLPVGALLGGLTQPTAAVRAGLVTATVLWAGLNLDDYGALTREIRAGRWPDHRGDAVAALEARGLQTLWGDFRLAYVFTLPLAGTLEGRLDDRARDRRDRAPRRRAGCAPW